MKNVLVVIVLMTALFSVSCTFMEDDATHLAYALEKGAKRLDKSAATEHVVYYQPLSGTNQIYQIVINSTRGPGTARGLSVGSSGTTYHRRFVHVPKRLEVVKTNTGAEIVLRKDGDRIEVVGIRYIRDVHGTFIGTVIINCSRRHLDAHESWLEKSTADHCALISSAPLRHHLRRSHG
jgi:hypothetical protein